ncbi:GntR family transcriptional regulator, transcriptional repressor for pyruvate dehydrogenase complex [Maribacter aquivivus]|uniref:GntR family transcriptional regulator, transcriptional repressor for pyruvate dehydrogenase complex n=1 Tax=Maribacter aquivivus TaxID=228958 RepID=A0A1M6IUF5_9FLAO|nr:FadR/GntR family transcriptional regulator [Maribacter aquivivus]SHJ38024.1 GntR family transcriptional regulator, transcriptional repressor for pyruvate dehydrogenase complex [Maribacter aquivivus]
MKLEIFTKNEHKELHNVIISNIRDLINNKNLEPGDKLPSERMLSERFEVSRSNVREAIQKLEFYGILKSKPQSGTFVADIGQVAMNGMMDDILGLEDPDFKSLVETRILLELKTVRLAAKRRTDDDLKSMELALDAFKEKVLNNEDAVQEDLLFHLAIAQACGNSTINRMMLIITPEIINNFEKYHVCDKNQSEKRLKEHQDIFDAIKEQNTQKAKQMMKNHFVELYKYCYNI